MCNVLEKWARHPAARKDGVAIIPAVFKVGGRLNDANVECLTALGIDVDGASEKGQHYLPPEDVHGLLPFASLAYSTYSSTPDHPRYRILMPLEAELCPADFRILWDHVNQVTGGHLMDPACKNPSRLYYLPRSPAEALAAGWPWVRRFGGRLLSMAVVPAALAEGAVGVMAAPPARVAATGVHGTPTSMGEAVRVLREILRHELVVWMVKSPGEVSRETWRGLASNLAAAAQGHPELIDVARRAFHEVSEVDDRYRFRDADRAFGDAIRSATDYGPMTFSHMVNNGAPAGVCGGGSALIDAARRRVYRRNDRRGSQCARI